MDDVDEDNQDTDTVDDDDHLVYFRFWLQAPSTHPAASTWDVSLTVNVQRTNAVYPKC